MTEQYASTELSEIARERRVSNNNTLFERGQQLRARLTVLQEARDLRLAEGRALLAPIEAAMITQPWDLRAVARYEAQRARNAGDLAAIDGEIAEVTKELNAPPPGRGANVKQWALVPGTEPVMRIPDESRILTTDKSKMYGG